MRIPKKFFPIVFVVPVLLGCNSGSDSANDFIVTLRTTDKFGQPSISFVQGDPINIVLTISNVSSVSKTLSFPSSKQYDFVLQDNSAVEVWRWSDGKAFTTAFTSYELAPGNIQTFTYQWDQTVANGSAWIPTGSYTLVAQDIGIDVTATQPLSIF